MRWRSVWLTACSCAVLLAGCGGEGHRSPPAPPRIPAGVADRLAADADRVAATPGCAARTAAVQLRDNVIAAIARVPARYQEQLTSAANDLVDRIRPCAQPEEKKHERRHHGKHKGKKKGHR
ncbi:MAG TPA: hypothetical protein VGJ27_05140 [Gaiellaceae bacterium]